VSGYTVLSAPVFLETEEKRSEFLTYLYPVTSREEALVWINEYKAKYTDANHVCWAYVIGNTRQPITQAFSDDGEPSGTAGKPMLHVLTERDVGNSLAIVVRYFGGIKLGAGGLVRAYSAAVSDAVNIAVLTAVIPSCQLDVSVPFARESKVRHHLMLNEGTIINVAYSQHVTLTIEIAETKKSEFIQRLTEETAGEITIIEPDE
jgi:uncharacterized YigZ family protein